METTKSAKVESVDMKLEVVLLCVSDVNRAKAFYEKLGWRLDIDIVAGDDFRGVQMTPHNSEASIIFGRGVTSAKFGSAELVLDVDNVDVARNDLIARGVVVSEVFHYAAGPSTTPWRTRALLVAIRKGVSTSRLHRSRIRTATAGCSRRSRSGFPAANGS